MSRRPSRIHMHSRHECAFECAFTPRPNTHSWGVCECRGLEAPACMRPECIGPDAKQGNRARRAAGRRAPPRTRSPASARAPAGEQTRGHGGHREGLAATGAVRGSAGQGRATEKLVAGGRHQSRSKQGAK